MNTVSRMPLLFVLFWSAVTLLFDGFILRGIVGQLQALSYSRTTGTITYSEVSEKTDSDGTTYGFVVRYAYEVDGRAYEGTRYRYSQSSSSNKAPARALKERFHEGATVPVFHSPEAPEEAVLETGVRGYELFFLLFMSPFNLVMLGGWYGVLLGRRKDEDEVGAFRRGDRVHVRLERTGAVAAGFVAFGVASFLAIFVVGIPTGFDPSLPTMLVTWGLLIATGVFFGRKHGAKLDAGDHDLILDEGTRRLSLPVGPDRTERLDVPWSQVHSVSVETHTSKDSDGDTVTTWRPTVVVTAANELGRRSEAIVDWKDEKRAAALVEWLKSRLRHRESVTKARMSG
ncbi:DUF3592 domain-containing protein [Archangium sp.]|jgi:hypothetical protein|uniref:DUF3592 domain-containing protein n=1 Tax=Archangium sp. TaxID=1872627 RepID=UPI002EDB42BA